MSDYYSWPYETAEEAALVASIPPLDILDKFQSDIKCYAVPYGAIGFLTYLATILAVIRITKLYQIQDDYYSFATLFGGNVFYSPTLRFRKTGKTILLITALGKLGLDAFSLVSCQFEQPMMMITLGHTLLGTFWAANIGGLLDWLPLYKTPRHTSIPLQAIPKSGSSQSTEPYDPEQNRSGSTARDQPPAYVAHHEAVAPVKRKALFNTLASAFFLLNIAGCIMIFAGTVSLLSQLKIPMEASRIITLARWGYGPKPGMVFGLHVASIFMIIFACIFSLALVIVFMTGVMRYDAGVDKNKAFGFRDLMRWCDSCVLPVLAILAIQVVCFADWIIATVAENPKGVPSADGPANAVARYWGYFALSILPWFVF